MHGWTLLIAILLTFAPDSRADGPAAEKVAPIHGRNVTLHGSRYANPGGIPVLNVHGLGETHESWENISKPLAEEGLDAWAFNFRGHGNGNEVSQIRNYRPGDYGIGRMVEDLDLMVHAVLTRTGKSQLVLNAHSMGGMVTRLWLAGAYYSETTGKLVLSSHYAAERQKKVLRAVLIGAPPELANAPVAYRALARSLDPLVKRSHRFFPFSPFQHFEPDSTPQGAVDWALRKLLTHGDAAIVRNLPTGIGRAANLEAAEDARRLLTKGTSGSLHTDVLASFAAILKNRPLDGLDYASVLDDADPVSCPILQIASEDDYFARASSVVEDTRRLAAKGSHAVAFGLRDASHVDPLFSSWLGRRVATVIRDFARNAKALGPSGTVFSPSGKCPMSYFLLRELGGA